MTVALPGSEHLSASGLSKTSPLFLKLLSTCMSRWDLEDQMGPKHQPWGLDTTLSYP